jgi:hypothetical protein
MYRKSDFPFGIFDVASLLGLRIKRYLAESVYTDCPLCGDRRGKMNLNHAKDLFRCNYCGEGGGMLALYARVCGTDIRYAYREIRDALRMGDIPLRKEMPSPPLPVLNATPASAADIGRTLSALLNLLDLSDAHRNALMRRGLTGEQTDRLGYKSTPSPGRCKGIAERLINDGFPVEGIPGFYADEQGHWTVKFPQWASGFLIPARNILGEILGMQIRLDHPIKDKDGHERVKYLWFSSADKHMGTSSGSPAHFIGDPCAKTVYATEGFLKADVSHFLSGKTFVATAGAGNTKGLNPVFLALSENGTRKVIEADDMDKITNEAVARGASEVCALARQYNMAPFRLTWNPIHKGFDDWQLALKQNEAGLSC